MFLSNALFMVPASTGLVFIVVGFFMHRFPPKKINGLYGYRTAKSMKSQDHWDFAQRFASIEMMRAGGILLLASLLGLVFDLTEDVGTLVGLGILILAIILMVVRVEQAIKRRFG